MANKLEKILRLSSEEFIFTVEKLLNNIGFSDIESKDDLIIGSSSGLMGGSQKSAFIIEDSKLSGKKDEERVLILKRIESIISEHKPNSIFIISNNTISKGFRASLNNSINNVIVDFMDSNEIIRKIDQEFPDFWKHEDLELIEYEKSYQVSIGGDHELRKLKIFNDKYQKLLDIFIDPRIYYTYEDKATKTPVRKKISIDDIINESRNQIIAGEAGTGKTTLLKKIGQELIIKNSELGKKNIPIFVSTVEIFESNYEIEDLISKKIKANFSSEVGFKDKYNQILLVDSIDELELDIQKKIFTSLIKLSKDPDTRFVLATRNSDQIQSFPSSLKNKVLQIDKFNNEQVKKFISSFFLSESNKAENLIDALKENRILERMPITPLSLSLISILYEENNLEIPATIADIYDNFNALIIGRSGVSSKVEFIDISFKERILSLYALHLLEALNNKPLSKSDFINFFTDYFEDKSSPVKKGTLEEALNHLIENTGILVIKEMKWVKFSHDSYMEYYAALEIFKYKREKESLLSDNFLKHNWQNSAIFYAGMSKDLSPFLEKVLVKMNDATRLNDLFMGILGSGYILQALYQTDNKLRKDVVVKALELSTKALELTMKLASDKPKIFKNYKVPILQIINVFYFFENFNSLTLREPLKLAFSEVYNKYNNSKSATDAFKAVKLALTLDSKRINSSNELEVVTEDSSIMKLPSLYLLLDFGLNLLGSGRYKKIKQDLKKDYLNKIEEPVRELIKLPASKLRFSKLDSISEERKVQIIVEGKTDAEILEHAYYCLTDGSMPYWKVKSAGVNSGGATEVNKTLTSAHPIVDEGHFVFGLFDHDAKGLSEYKRLSGKLFEEKTKNTLKKHIENNIYAICIPVPGELDHYLMTEQVLNYFEIEHYFSVELLSKFKMIEKSPLEGDIFKIKDSGKKEFSKGIRSLEGPEEFQHFITLFEMIDSLTGESIEYLSI